MAGPNAILIPMLGAVSLAIASPFLFAFYRRIEHRKRRRLEQSRREIRVLTGEEAEDNGECRHRRSKSRARLDSGGTYRSVCKYCGAPMKRLGPKDWILDEAEAAAA